MKSKEIVLFVTNNNKIISSSKRTSQALVNHIQQKWSGSCTKEYIMDLNNNYKHVI